MVDDVKKAIAVFVEHKQSDDVAICAALVAQGRTLAQAESLLVVMPIAFARVLLAELGVVCTPTYILRTHSGVQLTRRFRALPVFCAAMTVATTGIDRDDFLAVAMHSAELKLVNRAISDGANPKHLLLAEPVLILPNEEPGVEDSFSKKKLPNTPKPVEPVNKGKGWLKRLMGG